MTDKSSIRRIFFWGKIQALGSLSSSRASSKQGSGSILLSTYTHNTNHYPQDSNTTVAPQTLLSQIGEGGPEGINEVRKAATRRPLLLVLMSLGCRKGFSIAAGLIEISIISVSILSASFTSSGS